MNFEQPGDQEQEWMKIWQDSVLPGPTDDARMVLEMTRRVEKFDRRIWWRNLREYAAGAILLAFFSWKSFSPASRVISVAGIIAVGFVMIYLWRSHRQTPPLDPSADSKSYHAALLGRYDVQIRLLGGVKYWYVLPLYLWMLMSIAMSVPRRETGRQIGSGLLVTVFSIFVVWLNEGYAVRKLRDKRKQAETLLEEGKE